MKNLKNPIRILFLAAICLLANQSFAQRSTIFGKWKTIDDETGKKRSIVKIEERNGKAYGTILELFREPDEPQDPICVECTDHRKDKKVIGMEIITGMEKDGDEWEDGEILDPENGKVYDCKMWVEDGKLKVRGYIAFLYRTQTWLPVE